MQYSTDLQDARIVAINAKLDAITDVIGPSPFLRIYSGAMPATCGHAATGNLLASIALSHDWMAAAANGVKVKIGIWRNSDAYASGEASYHRFYENSLTTCHMQGTVTVTDGGGDLELSSINIVQHQVVVIDTYTLTGS